MIAGLIELFPRISLVIELYNGIFAIEEKSVLSESIKCGKWLLEHDTQSSSVNL